MSSDSEDECPNFKNQDEEIKFWKTKAIDYKKRLKESVLELEEYQSHSSELETELEAELEQSSARCSELRHQVAKLASENEDLKERLSTQSMSLEGRVDSLEEELQDVRSIKDGLTTYIRQLEQANDDLERAKRATLTSLEDFESRLNQAIERNAFLESELDEKENLKEMVQRLKDESRDLRQELTVQQQTKPVGDLDNDMAAVVAAAANNSCSPAAPIKDKHVNGTSSPAPLIIDSNKLAEEEPQSQCGGDGLKNSTNSNPLTPSARISALNIVGDLLRKVGALETRLATCRTLVKDNHRTPNINHSTASAGNNSAR